jgi:MFS family permease
LVIPFGAASGFLGVTIVYLLGRAGVDPVTIAVLTGLSFLPHTFKFLYAPLVDLTLTRKRWFVMASITSALGIALIGMVPATEAGLPWLRVLVVVGNLATAFLSMAVESLMAYNTAPGELGRTAGWFQAGNLGGSGLGGGLALVIAENTSLPWLPGVVLAVICLLSGIAIRYTTEPEPHLPELRDEPKDAAASQKTVHVVWRAIQRVLLDMWQVARSRMGYLGLLICFLPIGSGAAGNLFPLFANEWGASSSDVAATSGALSGLLAALGCMVGGHFCDRMDRKKAYAFFGILMSACAVLMSWAPHTLTMYYVFVLGYGFIGGLCFASFTAVTLEAIGTGAAATKYSIFASLSNTPIAYMGILNSYFYDKSGSNAGLYSDAAMGVAGVGVFLLVAVVSKRLHRP